jgi:hypothetical protein
MGIALVGFVGVIVGGLIAVMGSWLDQIRGEVNDAMVAARLVRADLARAEAAGGGAEPSAGIWTANSGALAKALGYHQWEAVAEAYQAGQSSGSDLVGAPTRARHELEPFARGKRSAVHQRWRNMRRRNDSVR